MVLLSRSTLSERGVSSSVSLEGRLAMLISQPSKDVFESIGPEEDIVDGGGVHFFDGFAAFKSSATARSDDHLKFYTIE